MNFKIIWGDITREKTDVVVTLASREQKVGSGVDRSVHAAAGKELLDARIKAEIKPLEPGQAVFTKAFGLAKTCGASNVIHLAGVVWEGGMQNEEILLGGNYLKAMSTANALGATTVSFPVIGAGKYRVPKAEALRIAVDSLRECLRSFPDMTVNLVVVEPEIFEKALDEYPQLCESHFTKAQEKAFRAKFPYPQAMDEKEFQSRLFNAAYSNRYWEGVKIRRLSQIGDFCKTVLAIWKLVVKRDEGIVSSNQIVRLATMTDLALTSGVSYSTVKHVFEGDSQRPRRDVVLALCVGMRLPLPFTQVMLKKCGYELTSQGRDAIIADYLEDGGGSIDVLNARISQNLGKEDRFKVHKAPEERKRCKAVTGSCPRR